MSSSDSVATATENASRLGHVINMSALITCTFELKHLLETTRLLLF